MKVSLSIDDIVGVFDSAEDSEICDLFYHRCSCQDNSYKRGMVRTGDCWEPCDNCENGRIDIPSTFGNMLLEFMNRYKNK